MDWTNGQTGLLAFLYFLMIVGVLGDAYTTAVGLSKGYKEKNSFMKYLFATIGESKAVFITGVAASFLGGSLAAHSLQWGYIFFSIVAAGEVAQSVVNLILLKRAGISLK